MPKTAPNVTRQGRLMLAAFGERSTLADFKIAVDLRPELDYSEADCLVGLEALTAAGLLKTCRVKANADPEWEITKAGHDYLTGAHSEAIGPPHEVLMEPQPAVANTSSEA